MIPALLFLASFALYLTTAGGTIPAYRDSGDLITAIFTLGIAHPPGYPFYVICGKLFSRGFPFANPAYRVNVFSAFCAALSVALVYAVGRHGVGFVPVNFKKDARGSAAFVAAVFYALSPAVVSLARVAEMYAMAVALGGLIVGCYAIGTERSALLGSFLLGLGFGVHPTLLFLAPLLLPLPSQTGAAWFQRALERLGFFTLGFSVVLFLLLRSRTDPLSNWGDPSTWGNLWSVLTRGNYGGLKLHPVESQFSWTFTGVIAQTMNFLQTVLHQWGWVGIFLGMLGMGLTMRQTKGLVFTWILAGPIFFVFSNLPIKEDTSAPILEPYLLLVNWLWALWIAGGLCAIVGRMSSRGGRWAGAAALMLVGWAACPEFPRSQRSYYYAYDLGRNLLRSLPQGAVLYDPDDQVSFTLRTLQVAEHRREDVALLNFFRTFWGYRQIIHRWPDLLPPGPVNNAQQLEQLFWAYSIRKHPFYADLPVKIPAELSYTVEGVIYRIQPPASALPQNFTRAENLFQVYAWQGRWHTDELPDFFTRHMLNYYAAAECNLGLKYAEARDYDQARWHYMRALCIDPRLAAAYNNLGIVDFAMKEYDPAIREYQLALRYEPDNAGFWRNLGLAYQAKGLQPQAGAAFQRASEPQNPS